MVGVSVGCGVRVPVGVGEGGTVLVGVRVGVNGGELTNGTYVQFCPGVTFTV